MDFVNSNCPVKRQLTKPLKKTKFGTPWRKKNGVAQTVT